MNTSIRNIFIASLISASIIGSAALATPAAAQSVGDIQRQIQELLAKIAALQEQLKLTVAAQGNASSSSAPVGDISFTAVPRICKIFPEHALSFGNRGEQVLGLQEFLKAEGYFSAEGTGFFGPLTRDALARWQAAQGFEAAGAMGPLTRERIRARCAQNDVLSVRPTSGSAPLTVTFSANVTLTNSAMIADAGEYKIVFGDGNEQKLECKDTVLGTCRGPITVSHTYQRDGSYTASLVHYGFFGPPEASVNGTVRGKVFVQVGGPVACTKEYMPVCGAKQVVCITTPCNPVQQTYGNRCMMAADGASLVHEGACRADTSDPAADARCRQWYDGCNTCSRQSAGGPAICTLRACTPESTTKPYCSEYFTDVANKPPTISALSGPTSLKVGESGSWTVQASDPENGQLYYSIVWGDESVYAYGLNTASARDTFSQTATFSHTYSREGTYTVIVVVRDTAGLEAKTTMSVRVSASSPTICTLEYAPVCGRPTGCANTCPPGQYCAAICRLHEPVTYGNRCQMNAAGATFLHQGECTANSSSIY